jgi:hypothetical protein
VISPIRVHGTAAPPHDDLIPSAATASQPATGSTVSTARDLADPSWWHEPGRMRPPRRCMMT